MAEKLSEPTEPGRLLQSLHSVIWYAGDVDTRTCDAAGTYRVVRESLKLADWIERNGGPAALLRAAAVAGYHAQRVADIDASVEHLLPNSVSGEIA